MKYAVAVLDIGKTNKKLVIYDDELNQIDSDFASFPTVKYDELDVENVEEINRWFIDGLKKMAEKYPVRVISVTTHGATGVCVDRNGSLAVPVVAYTNEADPAIDKEFYDLAGDKNELQIRTATAEIKPLINLAKLIFFLKKRFPEDFNKTDTILFYPQYFSYILTGKKAADYTYAGCHTYLWDFDKWEWSDVADKLGIRHMLPDRINRPGDILGRISGDIAEKTGLDPSTIVTTGIHDSNSSLIPYLIKGEKNFILDSTGTWCVVMHPTDSLSFKKDELGKMIYYNISAYKDLVKTAIFMGGLEFETYANILKEINGTDDYPDFDPEEAGKIIKEKRSFILPGVVKGAGQFPESDPRVVEKDTVYSLEEISEKKRIPEFFNNHTQAHHVLSISLALQTKVAIDRINAPKGSPIYVEGGFRNNGIYIKTLASLYPDSPIFLTSISEATSYGAALLGKAAYENVPEKSLKEFVNIDPEKIAPVKIEGIDEYFKQFLLLLENR